MAAKVTLGCLSKVLDEEWLDTPDAAKYRGWLWDETPVNQDGSLAGAFPSRPFEAELHMLRPPEHLLYFHPLDASRVALSIAYFGSLIVRAPVVVGALAMPRTAWRTVRGAEPVETTFDALLREAALKLVEEAGSTEAAAASHSDK
jgi:hypothetical protein